jgi:RNA polymerase-binding transcription factor DksA
MLYVWGMDDLRAPLSASPIGPELALLEGVRRDLDAVEAALANAGDDGYGTCAACGEPLPDEVLAESPLARWCQLHEQRRPPLQAPQ